MQNHSYADFTQSGLDFLKASLSNHPHNDLHSGCGRVHCITAWNMLLFFIGLFVNLHIFKQNLYSSQKTKTYLIVRNDFYAYGGFDGKNLTLTCECVQNDISWSIPITQLCFQETTQTSASSSCNS